MDATAIGSEFDLHVLPVGPRLARAVAALSWHLHLQPTEPGWFDLAFQSPTLNAGHAKKELGWEPSQSSLAVLRGLAEALQSGGGLPTPPLRRGLGLRRPGTDSVESFHS